MTDVHQVKAGLYFSSQPFNKYHHEGWAKVGRLNDVLPQEFTPWEGAAYIQDKIETKGMIINLGLRIDAFNGNAWVSDDPFDPLRIDEETPGNIGQNMVSVGDPVTYQGISESDEGVVKTSTKFALSPRIGISHPITENTVFHFMYGHFNQRSGWHKILSHPYWMFRPWPIQLYPETHSAHMIPFTQEYLDDQGVTKRYQGAIGPGGNPDLTFERMIQYEVGFDQNIADLLRVDVTMYYRDGQNLTSAGFREQRDLSYNTRGQTSLRLLADYDRLGAGTGDVRMWINGQFLDSRGIEFSLETQFRRFFNLRFLYDMSYTKTGAYGPNTIYRVFPDGRKAGNQEDSYFGGSNTDRGNNINNNQFWNPNNNFKLVGNFFTPRTFGPELSSFYPLGDWNLNFQVRWVQGRQYTYHSVLQGDFSTEPNNRRWEDLWNTNMSIRKGFQLSANVRANLFVDVINLFDQNQLQLPSGSWREEYHENGVLPYTILGEGTPYETQYDNEWTWYVINQLPREVFFGIGLEF
jgi:hypothetical protein